MQKIDLADLKTSSMMNLFVSIIVDDVVSSDVSRAKAREAVTDHVKESASLLELAAMQRLGESARSGWGATPMHQQGAEQAMALAGGPAAPLSVED